MKKFTDGEDHVWGITLTIGSVRRIKDECGLDLFAPQKGDDTHLDAKGNPKTILERMADEDWLLLEVIGACIQDQADELKLTKAQVEGRFTAPVMMAAAQAFWDELADFYQSRGQSIWARVAAAAVKVTKAQAEMLDRKFREVDIDGQVAKMEKAMEGLPVGEMVNREVDEGIAKAKATFGATFGKSPEPQG